MSNDPGNPTAPVDNPTYMANIRHFFTSSDIGCMRARGIDLATYGGVKTNALRIYFRVEDGSMPPDPSRRWSEAKVRTFYNWIKAGYPRGTATAKALEAPAPSATRLRRNITSLNADEITRLKTAFREIMARDPDDPTSYFHVAGLHWLPEPDLYCRHHENAYNPWHRLYMNRFEDVLRSVPGCEDITMPYWDITDPVVPAVLFEEPFASYTYQRDLEPLEGDPFKAGTPTDRYDAKTIAAGLHSPDIMMKQNIDTALGHSHWEKFNGWAEGQRTQDGIIRAHDNGHNVSGPTMQNQDVAAFDPIFWFFHCNWDRLWWRWQQAYGATTVAAFRTHMEEKADWLDDPVINRLPPFDMSSPETIDLTAFGVAYEHPPEPAALSESPLVFGSIQAKEGFSQSSDLVSVRVKGINRLNIPGSFNVTLMAGDKTIGTQGFFQPSNPKRCGNCSKKGTVNFDFLVEHADLKGAKVHARIDYFLRNGKTAEFPLEECGSPSINARLLLG